MGGLGNVVQGDCPYGMHHNPELEGPPGQMILRLKLRPSFQCCLFVKRPGDPG